MSSISNQPINFKEIAQRENNFNYSVASLGDIYRPYLSPQKEERKYDILTEEEMYLRGLNQNQKNFSYKNYNKNSYQPQDPNLKNININQVDLNKGISKNINLNQPKSQGILKGHKLKIQQRPTSAISTKKIKYNQAFDPAQKNRIMDVNYLHLTKLPESKKFSHVDKAIINPVQSTFSVKKIVDDNIKKHEKMMRPIVLYPDPVKIYNEQPEKILPGSLRRSQEEFKRYDNNNKVRQNMMVIGTGYNPQNMNKDNHVTFEYPKDKKFIRKNSFTNHARKTLRDSENFVDALENFFISTDLNVPPKYNIKTILNNYAEKLEKSLEDYEYYLKTGKKLKNQEDKNKIQSKFARRTIFEFERKKRKKNKIKIEKKPKIADIDYDFRKKIQERLSRLQLNLRQIFDNISILKKNKSKQNIKLINEQMKKAKELINYVRHLATDVENGEKEFEKSFHNSFQRTKSQSPNKNIIKNISNNSSFSKTMNNFNHPSLNNINENNNINTSNNQQNMSKTNPPRMENQLENSSTSISSNINPINSFSAENQNLSNNNNKLLYYPQNQSQNSTLMASKANNYIKNKSFNPIIEEPNEDNNNIISTNSNNNINKNINLNSNYFLQSTNSFKEIKESNNNINNNTNIKPKPNVSFNISKQKSKSIPKKIISKTNPNNNKDSKTFTITLAEPEYFLKKPLISQEFHGTQSISISNPKSSDVLNQNNVINNIDQTINHVPMKVEEMKVNTKNYIEDERYSAFNVEFPVKYYYELSREHEPPKIKEWFLRPHHTETFVESKKAIPDDIMNTKYISYYAPGTENKQKTRQDVIEELIMETRARINELQEDMFKKSNLDSEGEKLYNKLEGLKEEAKKSFIPGFRDAKEAKQKNIFEMLKDPNSGASYTEMFDQNDDIKQTNFAISSVGTMLSELRDKERDLVNIKRKQEYERIRPPIDRWYELKGDNFLNEIIRNKMVLNSGPEYFQKIDELQDDDLY